MRPGDSGEETARRGVGYHSGLLVGGPPGASDTPEGFSPNRPASWGAPHQLSMGGLRVGPGARSVAPTVSAPPSKLLSGKKTDSGKKDFRALQVREHAFCLSFKRTPGSPVLCPSSTCTHGTVPRAELTPHWRWPQSQEGNRRAHPPEARTTSP